MAIPAEVFHVGVYVREEMLARDWDEHDLTLAMLGNPESVDIQKYRTTRTVVDFLMHTRHPQMRLGDVAKLLETAFGVSAQTWTNLDDAWRNHPSTLRPQGEGREHG